MSEKPEDISMFLEETTSSCAEVKSPFIPLPKILRDVYQSAEVKSESEALIAVLHCLMLETGFITVLNVSDGNGSMERVLPDNWKSEISGVYNIEYSHKKCPSSSSQVTFIPLGTSLAVHGTILNKGSDNSVTTVLAIRNFIKNTKGLSDPVEVYHNLPELCRNFKDSFAFSLLANIEHAFELESSFGLTGLPIDAKFFLLGYLPVEGVVALSATNKEFNSLADSSFVWKCLFLRDFADELPENTKDQHEWKELYVAEYMKEKAKRKKQEDIYKCCKWPPWLYRGVPFRRFIPPIDPRSGVDLGIDLDPVLQETFPYLRQRFPARNPFFDNSVLKGPPSFFRFL